MELALRIKCLLALFCLLFVANISADPGDSTEVTPNSCSEEFKNSSKDVLVVFDDTEFGADLCEKSLKLFEKYNWESEFVKDEILNSKSGEEKYAFVHLGSEGSAPVEFTYNEAKDLVNVVRELGCTNVTGQKSEALDVKWNPNSKKALIILTGNSQNSPESYYDTFNVSNENADFIFVYVNGFENHAPETYEKAESYSFNYMKNKNFSVDYYPATASEEACSKLLQKEILLRRTARDDDAPESQSKVFLENLYVYIEGLLPYVYSSGLSEKSSLKKNELSEDFNSSQSEAVDTKDEKQDGTNFSVNTQSEFDTFDQQNETLYDNNKSEQQFSVFSYGGGIPYDYVADSNSSDTGTKEESQPSPEKLDSKDSKDNSQNPETSLDEAKGSKVVLFGLSPLTEVGNYYLINKEDVVYIENTTDEELEAQSSESTESNSSPLKDQSMPWSSRNRQLRSYTKYDEPYPPDHPHFRESQQKSEHEHEHGPEHEQEHVPEHEQEHAPEHEQEHVPEHEQEHVPEHEREHVPEHEQEQSAEAGAETQTEQAAEQTNPQDELGASQEATQKFLEAQNNPAVNSEETQLNTYIDVETGLPYQEEVQSQRISSGAVVQDDSTNKELLNAYESENLFDDTQANVSENTESKISNLKLPYPDTTNASTESGMETNDYSGITVTPQDITYNEVTTEDALPDVNEESLDEETQYESEGMSDNIYFIPGVGAVAVVSGLATAVYIYKKRLTKNISRQVANCSGVYQRGNHPSYKATGCQISNPLYINPGSTI